MSKRDALYDELFDEEGVRLSEDDETNMENGRRLFGAILIGVMDRTIAAGLGAIDGSSEGAPGVSEDGERQELREAFSAMNDAQRDAVRNLLRDNVSLMLFSLCSKLDQFPGFDVAIHLRTLPTDHSGMREFVIASGDHDELHHDYYQWVDEFSDEVTER